MECMGVERVAMLRPRALRPATVPTWACGNSGQSGDFKKINNSAREWPGASSRFASGGPSRPGRPFVSSASLLLAREGCMAHRLAPLTLASSLRVGPARRACCFTKGGRPLRGHRPVLIVCCAEYERRSSSSVDRTLRREQAFIPAHAVKSESWCRRCVTRTCKKAHDRSRGLRRKARRGNQKARATGRVSS